MTQKVIFVYFCALSYKSSINNLDFIVRGRAFMSSEIRIIKKNE